jgi:hypothetical protein
MQAQRYLRQAQAQPQRAERLQIAQQRRNQTTRKPEAEPSSAFDPRSASSKS